jgi:hypothetical protein
MEVTVKMHVVLHIAKLRPRELWFCAQEHRSRQVEKAIRTLMYPSLVSLSPLVQCVLDVLRGPQTGGQGLCVHHSISCGHHQPDTLHTQQQLSKHECRSESVHSPAKGKAGKQAMEGPGLG